MLVQECITFYKCRILDFLLAHKFGPGESPRQAPSMRFMLPLWLATCSTSDTFTLPVTTKQDLRPYVSNLPTSIPVPRGSGDGFGIPNPRDSGSVIGADRTVWALLCVAERRATRPNGEWGFSTRRQCWATSGQRRCHPQEALYLPTFSHLFAHLLHLYFGVSPLH